MSVFIGFPLNLPYYILHSLFKMSNVIKKGPKHVSHSLFHRGLVRMLIDNELLKSGRSWDEFVESNGFSLFCHCMFDNPDDCNKHRDPSSVPVPSPRKYMLSPGRISPETCKVSMDKPVKGAHTPLGSKRVRTASSLSPITPPNNTDKIHGHGRDRPKAKLAARFTRSMAKGNYVKTPVSNSSRIETVVIDDEPENPSLPVNVQSVEREFDVNLYHDNPPAVDKAVRVDPVIGHTTKEKHVDSGSPGSYCFDGMMHPLFINFFLDKVHRMEDRMK